MAVQDYYDFINKAYDEGEDSDLVKGLVPLSTPAKRRKYLKAEGFEILADDLDDIDDQDVMNRATVVYGWLDWYRGTRKELFG